MKTYFEKKIEHVAQDLTERELDFIELDNEMVKFGFHKIGRASCRERV